MFPEQYEPNIISILESSDERDYWLETLRRLNPGLMEKAIASVKKNDNVDNEVQGSMNVQERLVMLLPHIWIVCKRSPQLMGESDCLSFSEMREECLRGFGFNDVYLEVKQKENAAALAVLPDY